MRDLCYPKEGEMPKDTPGEGCVSRRRQFVKLTSLMAVFTVPVFAISSRRNYAHKESWIRYP
jgi:hypothetical protein